MEALAAASPSPTAPTTSARRSAGRCARCSAPSASPARRARSPACPPAAGRASPLLVLVGMGEKPRRPRRRGPRRTPGRGRRRAVHGQRRVGRTRPARRRRRPGPQRARGLPPRWLRLLPLPVQDPGQAGRHRHRAQPGRAPAGGRRRRSRTRRSSLAAVNAVRDWVNTPAGDLTPPPFADEITRAARAPRSRSTVLDDAALAELGCGGLLGVGGGSSAPPRLVELRYSPADPVAHLALVGKGITFDSGGLSIKTAAGMETMKCDMAGAATITQATLAIAAARAAGPGHGVRLPGREHGVRHLDATRRRAHDLRRQDRRGAQHRRRGPAGAGRRSGAGDRAGARRDHRRGDADRPHDDGARQPRRRGVRQRRGRRRRSSRPGASPARSTGRCRSRRTSSTGCTAARSPTSPSTTGTAGAAGCSRRRSCASSPTGVPWAHLDIAGPGFNNGAAAGHWPPGGTGFAPDHPGRLRAGPRRRLGPPRSFCRLMYSRMRCGMPTTPASYAWMPAPLAERVGPVRRRHPAPGELAVPGHEQQRDVADRRARLDETLDSFAGGHEVLEVLLVVARRRPHPRRARCARCLRRGGGSAVHDRVRRVS